MLLPDVPHPDLLQKIQSGKIKIPYYLKNIDRLRSEGVNTLARLSNRKPPELPSANTEFDCNAIAILVNDYDPDGSVNPSTVTIVSNFQHGSYTINPAEGQLSYQPVANYCGSDQFCYTIQDNQAAVSNIAQVNIEITPVNDPPIISGLLDTLSLPADSTVSLQIGYFVNNLETPDPDLLYQFVQDPRLLQLNYQNRNGILQLASLPGATGLVLLELTVTDYKGAFDCDTVLVKLEMVIGFTDISKSLIPREYFLDQNYPNPFNPTTTICFGLPEDSWIRIDIFNLQGQLLRSVEQDRRPTGIHQIIIDAADLASGIYFYRMVVRSLSVPANGFVQI